MANSARAEHEYEGLHWRVVKRSDPEARVTVTRLGNRRRSTSFSALRYWIRSMSWCSERPKSVLNHEGKKAGIEAA